MGWFDEQIRQRKLSDQEILEDSMLQMASVVLGKRRADHLYDEGIAAREAIDEILKYYRCKSVEIPESIGDLDEQLEYCLRPHGLMRRNIVLEENWFRDGYGPVLAFRKSDGAAVALLPGSVSGYSFRDPDTGAKRKVDSAAAAEFDRNAICFYRPLPLRELKIWDLILFLKDTLSASDQLWIVALSFAATVLGMLMTNITRALTGFVLKSGNGTLLLGTAVFMITAILSARLVDCTRSLMMSRIELKSSLSVEAAMMMRLMNMPANFFRRYSSGELSSRYEAVGQLCELIIGSLFSIGLSSVFSLLYLAQIHHYAPALTLPALLIVAVTLAFSVVSALTQIRLSREIMKKGAKLNGLSFALVSGVQKIKMAGAEKRAFAKWAQSYAETSAPSYNPPLIIKANAAITRAISLVGTIILYYLAVQTRVSPSEYIAFNTAFGAVTGAFASLTAVALSLARIRPILEMAEPILKTKPETSEERSMVTRLGGSIELSNVCFRYNDHMPYVIDGLDLKIRAGEYVAIVGTTGCGKSTLLRLLLGFETPEKGAVYYDGKDLAKLDLRSLRRHIGTVTQDGTLFQGDIYSNIVISAPQLSLDEAWEAAEIAGIADDIRAMPMGMQTVIAEGQGGISGGQKQRLMIARAIAPKPKILLFDEATSALDNKTQKKVSDALDGLKCTRIVIAHRLSTIRNCDRILVLSGGKIRESGTYDELIAQNGFFAELVERQRLDL